MWKAIFCPFSERQAAKELAQRQGRTAGLVLSELARRGLASHASAPKRGRSVSRGGVPVIPSRSEVSPPPYEALVGNLRGAFARRINIQHRLVYQVLEDKRVVKILRLWTHYE